MVYQKILIQVKELVRNYFSDHLNPNRIYHNLQHTQDVVEWAMQLAGYYKLDSKSLFIIEVAAWFHEIAYFENPDHHEKKGSQLAEKFLKEKAVPEDLVKRIKSCMMASRIPQQPKNLEEQIFCDAAMFHLGREDFDLRSKLLRKEHALVSGKKISKEEWKQRNIEILRSHRFKTDYAKQLLAGQQKENLEMLLNEKLKSPQVAALTSDSLHKEVYLPLNKPGTKTENTNEVGTSISQSDHPAPDGVSKNKNRPDRGIETMFRVTSENHQALSQMADSKAHIMITVNSIIISVLLSVLFRSLDNEPHLALPVAILLVVNVITIVFSILATRPNIPSGNFSKEDLKNENVNLLFFGNYYKMNIDDFSDGMSRLMENRDFLYGSLIKNLHSQGLVLGRKYRLLRISYNIFMYGLVISIVAFGIAILIKQF